MHKVVRPRHGLAQLKLDELWAYRELIVFFAWRDVLVRYKQTVFGVAWAVIRPLIPMLIFTIVFGKVAKFPTGSIPYPIFALAGLLPWQLFATAFGDASNSVVGNSQLVSKVYFPRLIIPISSAATALADFAVSAVMLLVLMLWYRVPLSVHVVWALPILALCFLFALGAGIWCAALFVRYRDVRHVIPFAVQMGLYISPVGFASSVVPERWRFLYSLNPMVGVIDGFRWSLFGGSQHPYAVAVTISIALTIAILVASMYYFRATERIFADII